MDNNDGKTEKLIFICNQIYYQSISSDFHDYVKKNTTRKQWENLRKIGKTFNVKLLTSDVLQKDKHEYFHLLTLCGKLHDFFLEKQEIERNKILPFYFITINPPPNSIKNFRELDNILMIFSIYIYCKNNLEYVIEQRSYEPIFKYQFEDNTIEYNGIHCHILLRKTSSAVKRCRVKKDLERLFERFRIKLQPWNSKTFQEFGPNLFDIWHDKRKYLRGDKGDEEKLEKVKIDEIIREHEKLKALFSSI